MTSGRCTACARNHLPDSGAIPNPAFSLFAVLDGDVMIQRWTDVNLAWAVNPGWRLHDFFVIGNPTRHAADGEDDREHFQRNTDGAHDDATVKVNVRIKFPFDEIRVAQSCHLEMFGNIQ